MQTFFQPKPAVAQHCGRSAGPGTINHEFFFFLLQLADRFIFYDQSMSGCDSYSIFGDQEKRNGKNAPRTSTSRLEFNPLDVRGRRLLHANHQVPEPFSQTNETRHETMVSETPETAENQEKGKPSTLYSGLVRDDVVVHS